MNYRALGRTGLQVSELSLGSMTWGEQNSEAEAHAQIEVALEAGVNLIDTAEMYPVPPRPDTQGLSERYLGTWLRRNPGRREQLLIASKVTGPARQPGRPTHVREGRNTLTRAHLFEAVDASLQRLQTDHIDLYQLHWPDRSLNIFGQREYVHPVDEVSVPIEETLAALGELVAAGKVRQVGVSNESPWGVARYLQLADHQGLPRIASIQNPYNLLNRGFEAGLSEFAHHDQVGLLAYSPLAFGTLSGKYLDGAWPQGARLTLFDRFSRYHAEVTQHAIAAYVALFQEHGLDPAQASLAWILRQPFVTSVLLGATRLDQLRSNLASATLQLTPEVTAGIERIHDVFPNPAP